MADRLINGISIDDGSMEAFSAQSKEEFMERGKQTLWVEESESTQKKWLEELYKLATESQPKEAKKK